MVLACTGNVLPVVLMPLSGYHASKPSDNPWEREVLVAVAVDVYMCVGVAVCVAVDVYVCVGVTV